MLRAQGSLISDIREVRSFSPFKDQIAVQGDILTASIHIQCFQSYESLSIGKELYSLNVVLNSLLEIVDEEISIVKAFNSNNDLGPIELLQEKKIETLAVLEKVFSVEKIEEPCSSAADGLLSESLISEAGDDELSAGSFEDLRV